MEFLTTGNIHVQISRRPIDVPTEELLFVADGEDVSVSDAFDGFVIIKLKRVPDKFIVIDPIEQEGIEP